MYTIVNQAIQQLPYIRLVKAEENTYHYLCFDTKQKENFTFIIRLIHPFRLEINFKYTYEGPRQRVRGSFLCYKLKEEIEKVMKVDAKCRLRLLMNADLVILHTKVIRDLNAHIEQHGYEKWKAQIRWEEYWVTLLCLIPLVSFFTNKHPQDTLKEKVLLLLISLLSPIAFFICISMVWCELREKAKETIYLKECLE